MAPRLFDLAEDAREMRDLALEWPAEVARLTPLLAADADAKEEDRR
jgi:hypothetical protein